MDQLREAIIAARKEQGINVAEVSRRTGIPKPTLDNFEYGRRMLSFTKLQEYAKAIGCKIIVTLQRQ
jgi:transcriptional regulator with XRE-family HTH domain